MRPRWELVLEWVTVCVGVLLSLGTVAWGVWRPMPEWERYVFIGMGVFFFSVFVLLSVFRKRLDASGTTIYGRAGEEKAELLEGLAFGMREYIEERKKNE